AAAPTPTLWSREALLVDLGRTASVSRVTFELSEAAWVARPWVEVSPDGRTWTAVPGSASLADATLSRMRDPRHALGDPACTAPGTWASERRPGGSGSRHGRSASGWAHGRGQ